MSNTTLTPEQIAFLDECTKGTWSLNYEGLVDIDGDFYCHSLGIADFKGILFGRISGDFICDNNNLVSLLGAPSKVNNFDCSNNLLVNLIEAPTEVQSFYCHDNHLTSLKGAPRIINGNFNCSNNCLTNFVGSTLVEVVGFFICSGNSIYSLEGGPLKVGGNYDCYCNKLTNLKGSPEIVGGMFDCSNNQLVSLEGAPRKVGRGFYCRYNNLRSLTGVPLEVDTDFIDSSNGMLYKFEVEFGFNHNPISESTIKMLWDKMRTFPNHSFGNILAMMESEIPKEDWLQLDKTEYDAQGEAKIKKNKDAGRLFRSLNLFEKP